MQQLTYYCRAGMHLFQETWDKLQNSYEDKQVLDVKGYLKDDLLEKKIGKVGSVV